MAVARPISRWIGRHLQFKRLRGWIRSLSPYCSLALFSVPVIILEPVKPVAAYLAATGQVVSGAVTFIVGELLKLVLVERLFHLTRDKLMRIPAFAWVYGKFAASRHGCRQPKPGVPSAPWAARRGTPLRGPEPGWSAASAGW